MRISCTFFRVEYLQTLFGIFLLRFISTLLTYLSNHLHQCELTDTYFMLWVRIQCNVVVFFLKLFQRLSLGTVSVGSRILWHSPTPHQCRVLFCFACFLTLQVALGSFFVFYVEVLKSSISARNSHFFSWRMVLETKIWAPEVLIAVEMSLLLSPLRWQSKEIGVCILTSIYTHIYKYFYMHHLYLC